MRKAFAATTLLVTMTLGAFAQTPVLHEVETEHYRVLSEVSEEHAAITAQRLEAMMELYNEYFHFDVSSLPARLKVRIFNSKERFDRYLTRIIDSTREDFIYLHYTDLEKSELVGFAMEDETAFNQALNHQSVIQFMRAFVANPPLWMREGFAVFFETTEFDPAFGAAIYRENLAWLETLKSIMDGSAGVTPLTLEEILTIDVAGAREQIDVFYPQAWGMVSFLVNSSNRDFNRILWDAISALDPNANLAENSARVRRRAFGFVSEDFLVEDFVGYVDDRRSFAGLVEDGIAAYAEGDVAAAEEAFVKAVNLEDENFIPFYYLGLINYDRRNYSLAEFYYNQALELGADDALTYYALGVNAFADNRFDQAVVFLNRTLELAPEEYTDRAEQILARIEG